MTVRDEFEQMYSELSRANVDIISKCRTGDTYYNDSKQSKINVAYAVFLRQQAKIDELEHENKFFRSKMLAAHLTLNESGLGETWAEDLSNELYRLVLLEAK